MAKRRRPSTLTDAAKALRSVAETLVILNELQMGKRPVGFVWDGPMADAEGTTLAQDGDALDGYARRKGRRKRGR